MLAEGARTVGNGELLQSIKEYSDSIKVMHIKRDTTWWQVNNKAPHQLCALCSMKENQERKNLENA